MSDIGTTADSTEEYIGTNQPAPIAGPRSGRWFPAMREIRQQLDQLSEGRFERLSHLDQVRVLSH
jgi:hypothetical protein